MTSTSCCERCWNIPSSVQGAVCFNPACECHQTVEKNILTDISPEKLKQLEESGVPITHLEKNDAPEWKERFEREFKHVHHPNIQAENIINDTKPLIVFIEAEKARSYEEGRQSAGVKYGTLVDNSGMYDAGYQKGYEEGKNVHWFDDGFKAGIAKAMEATREAPAQGHASNRAGEGAKQHLIIREDLLTTLEKLDL